MWPILVGSVIMSIVAFVALRASEAPAETPDEPLDEDREPDEPLDEDSEPDEPDEPTPNDAPDESDEPTPNDAPDDYDDADVYYDVDAAKVRARRARIPKVKP